MKPTVPHRILRHGRVFAIAFACAMLAYAAGHAVVWLMRLAGLR